MSEQSHTRRDPIVPERNERIGRQSNSPRSERPRKTRSGASGSVGAFWKFLVILLLSAVIAVSYLAFMQYQQLTTLQASFDSLQGKLDSTDESLSQSGTALSLKMKEQEAELAKHWAEIRKLWGVSNDRNKKSIAENATRLKGVENSTKARKKALANLQQKLDKTVIELKRSIESAKSTALATRLEIEESADSSQQLIDRLNKFEHSLKQWQQEVNRRVAGNEEAVEAIDAFRRSTNQQLLEIKQLQAAPAG